MVGVICPSGRTRKDRAFLSFDDFSVGKTVEKFDQRRNPVTVGISAEKTNVHPSSA